VQVLFTTAWTGERVVAVAVCADANGYLRRQ
jgi:hypothetical protein